MLKLHAETRWASASPTPAQLKEFFSQIDSGRITKARLQVFLRGETDANHVWEQKDGWAKFYKKFFGIDLDTSSIHVPMPQPGFDRLIVVAQGLTLNQVYDACAKRFPCWRYADDLDKAIPNNDRDPKSGHSAIWVRDRVEADEENKNLSANDLKEKGILGITLLEHMIYELRYYDETGQRLDRYDWTLCSGSRDSSGGVPCAHCYSAYFLVYWCPSGRSRETLRSRSVVS